MSDQLLEARELHKSYIVGHQPLHVLRGASLSVARGEFLAIRGVSGSGKSTLLHLLGALDVPDRGTVQFEGKDLFRTSRVQQRLYRNLKIGFVFQFYHLLPECNILENVLLPKLVQHSVWSWRRARRQARSEAMALIERMGLGERVKHRPTELSGGERQRVAIARALINRPSVLLADEPTGNLDADVSAEVLGLLSELHQEGQTLVMVTHDSAIAQRADRCVQLSEGIIKPVTSTGLASAAAQAFEKEVAS